MSQDVNQINAAVHTSRRRLYRSLISASLLVALAACSVTRAEQPISSIQDAAEHAREFPQQLLGVWDVAPYPCFVDSRSESDTRIEIRTRTLQGYEDTEELKTIRQISESPMAWRILTLTNIAPAEVQGAQIYIMDKDALTISDGSYAQAYIRCR